MKMCSVNKCLGKHMAKGYCNKHYAQVRLYGHVLSSTIFDPNEWYTKDGVGVIVLRNKKKVPIGQVIVDLNRIEELILTKWHLHKDGYARSPKLGLMHHLIIGKPTTGVIDHINRNPLDNRFENLRFCSSIENLANTPKSINNKSGYKGVCWNKQRNIWSATLSHNGVRFYLGDFPTKKEAAEAYNNKAVEVQGGFACLNII